MSPKTHALARFGSFYAGGRQIRVSGQPVRTIAFTQTTPYEYDPNGLFHVEQAYVQYFIPAEPRCELPLVMLHGGGMCGTMWEHTPDGRDGWAQAFVAQGFSVYVVDNVERGRAGWAPFPGVWPDAPIVRSAEEAWSLFRFGAAGDFQARRPFAGQRFPVECLDTFIQTAVPRWPSNNDVAADTFCAALERIGPCLLMTHSHGGEVGFRAAARHPELVRGIVAIEPSGYCRPGEVPALGASACLFVYGDYLDATPTWQMLTRRGMEFRDALLRAGIEAEWWELPRMGVQGNSHMLMMDDNSDEIAQRVGDWLRERY